MATYPCRPLLEWSLRGDDNTSRPGAYSSGRTGGSGPPLMTSKRKRSRKPHAKLRRICLLLSRSSRLETPAETDSHAPRNGARNFAAPEWNVWTWFCHRGRIWRVSTCSAKSYLSRLLILAPWTWQGVDGFRRHSRAGLPDRFSRSRWVPRHGADRIPRSTWHQISGYYDAIRRTVDAARGASSALLSWLRAILSSFRMRPRSPLTRKLMAGRHLLQQESPRKGSRVELTRNSFKRR